MDNSDIGVIPWTSTIKKHKVHSKSCIARPQIPVNVYANSMSIKNVQLVIL